MNELFKNHPCFDDEARHKFQRVHLPVAPRCNIQCNFCNRKFDCVNESRPGVTSGIFTPLEASNFVDELVKVAPNLSVAGIAGPGDPFANPHETMETLDLIRRNHKDILLCVATNGLNIKEYIDELAELKVSHVTITVNAVDPEIGKNIYSWARYEKRVINGIDAAKILLEKQLEAVTLLKQKNITVKINSIIIPGINDFHIAAVAEKLSGIGIDILNPLSLYPVAETAFANIPEPDKDLLKNIKLDAGKYVNIMHNCTRCRADAVGLLGGNKTIFDIKDVLLNNCKKSSEIKKYFPDSTKKNIAVATMEGLLVNKHLGEAKFLNIYAKKEGKYFFMEKRTVPKRGGGEERWTELAKIVSDCAYVLVNGAGAKPVNTLKRSGIEVMTTEGLIEEILKEIALGADLSKIQKVFSGCGIECSGSGSGCG